eukprot:1191750-Prorocentrum_minimum.AAC.7
MSGFQENRHSTVCGPDSPMCCGSGCGRGECWGPPPHPSAPPPSGSRLGYAPAARAECCTPAEGTKGILGWDTVGKWGAVPTQRCFVGNPKNVLCAYSSRPREVVI